MIVITLPMFASARDQADELVDESLTSSTVKAVRVDGRDLDTSTDSFAEELTEQLVERDVDHVTLVGGGDDWYGKVQKYAKRLNLAVDIEGLKHA